MRCSKRKNYKVTEKRGEERKDLYDEGIKIGESSRAGRTEEKEIRLRAELKKRTEETGKR
jgi:hypothetical protein